MLKILTVLLLTMAAASAQTLAPGQPSWQDLALRAQQNGTVQQMVDNGIIAALQAEIVELKAQLQKKADPPLDPK